MEYAIVLPAGSGKTTLVAKYPHLVDIDALHTDDFKTTLRELYTECLRTGDWGRYNSFEAETIKPLVQQLTRNHILLVHSAAKASLLGLKLLRQWKVSRSQRLRGTTTSV